MHPFSLCPFSLCPRSCEGRPSVCLTLGGHRNELFWIKWSILSPQPQALANPYPAPSQRWAKTSAEEYKPGPWKEKSCGPPVCSLWGSEASTSEMDSICHQVCLKKDCEKWAQSPPLQLYKEIKMVAKATWPGGSPHREAALWETLQLQKNQHFVSFWNGVLLLIH